MPTRTLSISAPRRSATPAISFMKLIRVASIALAAYFVSSADRASISDRSIVIAVEWFVQRLERFSRARVVGPDDDPVGFHEVGDGGALLQEFRVGDHVEFQVHAARSECFLNRGANPIGGADRHGGLVHDDAGGMHVTADRAGDRQDMLQVRGTVLERRRAHGNELKRTELHSARNVRGELQATGRKPPFEQGPSGPVRRWAARRAEGGRPCLRRCRRKACDYRPRQDTRR